AVVKDSFAGGPPGQQHVGDGAGHGSDAGRRLQTRTTRSLSVRRGRPFETPRSVTTARPGFRPLAFTRTSVKDPQAAVPARGGSGRPLPFTFARASARGVERDAPSR